MKQPAGKAFSVFLDNNLAGKSATGAGEAAYLYEQPVDLIIVDDPLKIPAAFDKIRQLLNEGFHIAGYFSYELGLYLEQKLTKLGKKHYKFPFIHLGIYQDRKILSAPDSEDYWQEKAGHGSYSLENVRLNISPERYEAALSDIDDYLSAGDIYQVNYTLKSLFDFEGSVENLFAALRKAQRVEYGAFLKGDDFSVLSLSPELFFRKKGRNIAVRPMKGTCPRGRTLTEDQQNAGDMHDDEKSRAENLMIVDLLRNDLSKISRPASVKLKSLYDVEKYRTLFQMTSSINSELSEGLDCVEMIKALFPCGSVTGAPKIRAMEIIAELEAEPRGIYTGAIGYFTPGGDSCFNVPIRTMTIDQKGRGEMGIGSGIVADSIIAAEYEECLLKARFVTSRFRDFDLIETMRWTAGEGIYLLDEHLGRLQKSATYFDFICGEQAIRDLLTDHTDFLDRQASWKIRLLLSRDGKVSVTSVKIDLTPDNKPKNIMLSEKSVDSRNPMLFHKVTDRVLYDRELRNCQAKQDCYDVIFLNEQGHLTEGSFNNIFLKRGGIFYTPPLNDGLLDGILRQSMFDDPSVNITEKSLTTADMKAAGQIFMGNSVRGLVEVYLTSTAP